VLPHAGGWATGGLPAAAERYRHDLLAVPGQAPTGGPLAAATGLSVAGRGVQLTSLRRRDDWLELRLVAYSSTPTVATITPVTEARRATLLGHPGDPLPTTAGTLTLPLTPWEIATLHFKR
jgi:alpha-mannosidase